jgi:N-acetylneuraminate lyase
MKRLKGLIPAVFTPMKSDRSLALEKIAPLTEQLINEKACAFYVCGSTGEGPMLSTNERKLVTEEYIQTVNERIPVIVQVGHQSIQEAAELAAHAQKAGASAIAAVPPNYFSIESLEILVDTMLPLAAAAPDLPFYYYHIPRLSGVRFNMADFLEAASKKIPTLKGVKFTDFNLSEFQECLEVGNGQFEIFYGCDEQFMYGLLSGATAAVGSTFNFAAPLYNRIIDAFDSGNLDDARKWQSKSIRMIHLMSQYRPQPAFKAAMQLIGLDCGPNRFPHHTLSNDEKKALQKDLEDIGFFNWGR